ncbi:unnamed protein product, partial [Medioppia subpectinata]
MFICVDIKIKAKLTERLVIVVDNEDMDSLDKWCDSAIINGKEWYICVFGGNECNEVEDSEELMRAHLRTQHGLQTSVHLVDNPLLTPSPSLQSGDDINPKCETSDEEAADNSDHSMGAESDESGDQSYISRVFGTSVRAKRPPSGDAGERPHKCTHSWCGSSYFTRQRLNTHLDHHRCGYGFDNTPGAPPVTGVCRRAKIDSFVTTIRPIDGQRSFECSFDGCVYKSAVLSHMKDHIHSRHVCPNRPNLIGRRSGCSSRVSATDETHDDRRRQSSPSFKSDDDLDPKYVTTDEEEGEGGGHDMDVQSDSSGSHVSSGDQTSAVRPEKGKRSTDGQSTSRKPAFKCRHEGCHYETPNKTLLGRHVRDEHPVSGRRRRRRQSVVVNRRFPCDRSDCNSSYSNRDTLARHMASHRCGYNMDDTPDQVSHPSDACRRPNIDSQYKTKRTAEDVKMFECGFDDCPYSTAVISSMRDHIHGIHVCPNRTSLRAATPRGRTPVGGSTRRVSNTRRVDASSDEESDDISEASEYNLILSSSQRIRKQSASHVSDAIESMVNDINRNARTQPPPQTPGQSAVESDHSDSDLNAGLPNVSPDDMNARSKSSGSDRPANQSLAHSSGGQSLMPNKRKRSKEDQPVMDSKQVYACEHKSCRFKTHSNKILTRHVTDQHSVSASTRPFRCRLKGCYSSYSTRARWVTHMASHGCGYNMDEMPDQVSQPSDACRRANIDSQCERSAITTDGQKSFQCPFDVCEYNTPIGERMRDHIHGQHVCPNRSNLRRELKSGRPLKCRSVEKRTPRERTVSSARRADTSSDDDSDDDSDGESDASEEAVELSRRKRSSQRIANKSVRQKRSAVQTSRETAVTDAQTQPVASTSRQSVVAKLKAKRNRNPRSSDGSSSGRDSDRDIWSTGSEAATESGASDSNWSENGSTTSRGGHKSAMSKKHKRSTADQPAIVTNSSALYECGREYCDFTAGDKE